MKPEKIIASFEYLDWRHILGAVIDVMEQIKSSSEPSDADTWAWNSRKLDELYEMVVKEWCDRADKDATWFPYSRDGVARLFLRVRKRNDEEIAEWRRVVDQTEANLF